jgi:hypothetical protein
MRKHAGSAFIIIFNKLHVQISCNREFGDVEDQSLLFPGGRAPQAKVYGCWWSGGGVGRLCIVHLLLPAVHCPFIPISLLGRYM